MAYGDTRYKYKYSTYCDAFHLSRRYMGTDEDIRNVFLNLPTPVLERILMAYEREHGSSARRYAEATYHKWKAGKVRMSGKVSERLINFLPRHLDFDQKYELVKRVWARFVPKKTISMRVTPFSSGGRLRKALTVALSSIRNAEIPREVEERVTWLSENDSQAAQRLLSRLKDVEFREACNLVTREVECILQRFRENGTTPLKADKVVEFPGTTITLKIRPGNFLDKLGILS